MTPSPSMRIKKEDIDPRNITRNIMGGIKRKNQNINSRRRLHEENRDYMSSEVLNCNQPCSEHMILTIPKKLHYMMNQDFNCPPLLGEDGISHVNHERLDRNGIASNSQVSTYTCAGS